jgi:sec-independent protein translocase protein TatB
MFDIGWPEIFVVAVVTLVVVGPKEIPHVLRNVMGWVKKARSLAREFQSGVDDMVREVELDKLKDNVVGGGEDALDFSNMIDPSGDAEKALDFEIPDLENDFKDEINDYEPSKTLTDYSNTDANVSQDSDGVSDGDGVDMAVQDDTSSNVVADPVVDHDDKPETKA